MKPVTIPNSFQAQAGPIPLNQLDGDFTALANVVNDFGTYGNYLVDTGPVNAWVVTIPAGTTFSLAAGVPVQVQVAVTTTSTTPTLNVNGTGAKTIVNADNTAPVVGQFVAGQIVQLQYDGTSYRAISYGASDPAQTSGQFTGTLTGTTTGSGPVYWIRQGNIVVLTITTINGTSNSNACTLTGLPSNLQPVTNNVIVPLALFLDNGSFSAGNCAAFISVGTGSITFYKNGSPTGFTTTGGKGPVECALTYSVQ